MPSWTRIPPVSVQALPSFINSAPAAAGSTTCLYSDTVLCTQAGWPMASQLAALDGPVSVNSSHHCCHYCYHFIHHSSCLWGKAKVVPTMLCLNRTLAHWISIRGLLYPAISCWTDLWCSANHSCWCKSGSFEICLDEGARFFVLFH